MDLLPITHIPVSRWAPDISGGGNTVSISSICISRLGSFVSWGDGPGQPGQPLSFRIRQLHCQLTIVGQIVMYSAKLRRCCRCPDPGILDMGLNWRTINLTKPIHYLMTLDGETDQTKRITKLNQTKILPLWKQLNRYLIWLGSGNMSWCPILAAESLVLSGCLYNRKRW